MQYTLLNYDVRYLTNLICLSRPFVIFDRIGQCFVVEFLIKSESH